MVACEGVVQTQFGIEEVVTTIDVQTLQRARYIIEIVIHTRNSVRDMAILQVAIEFQTTSNQPIGLHVARSVPLRGVVAIVLGRGERGRKLQLRHLAKVSTIVERQRHTHRKCQSIRGVVCRRHHATKIIRHRLLANQIGACNRRIANRNRRQTILSELLIVLVVAIVTIAVGVVCRCIHLPLVVKDVVENQLIIQLRVVVGVIIEETHNRILHVATCRRSVTPNLTLGIVATILLDLIQRKTRIS